MRKQITLLSALALFVVSLSGCFATVPETHEVTYTTAPATKTTVVTSTPTVVTSTPTVVTSTPGNVVYQGPHPVYSTIGTQDWCNIQGPHTHAYAPTSMDFYVRQSNRLIFIGDPTYYVTTVNFNTYAYMVAYF